jgi:hypothetical protein
MPIMLMPRLENDSMKVIDIVDAYRSGRIAIPEFQRDYVWRKNRAPKLIDSLYRKFPVSALLFWQSAEQGVARRPSPKPAKGSMSWLIDGQQRVMTLSRVMNGDEGLDVVFNPDVEQFSLVNAATRKDPNWIRLATLFDDDEWRELRRELPGGNKGKKLEALLDRVRDIQNYEIPVVQMVNHTFDEAVDAFTRINSLGVRLKAQDIASARVAARHSGLIANDVAPFMERLAAAGLKRLSVMHLFRVCAFIASPDARMRTPLHELSKKDVMDAWKRTEKATLAASAIIRSELGLVNMDILWSGALLVPIIAMMADAKPSKADPKGMIGWLALAALTHRYSASTETALDQDLKACRAEDPLGALLTNLRQRQRANGLLARPQDFSGSLHDRSALLATYIACKNHGMKDIFTSQTIVMQDGIERHHVLPRRQFPEARRASADVVANVAFITSEVNKSISHTGPEVYLKEIDRALLESQCIPVDSSLWYVKTADEFFAERRELLAESLNDFLREALPKRRL